MSRRGCQTLHQVVRALRPEGIPAGASESRGYYVVSALAAASASSRCVTGLLASASRAGLSQRAQAAAQTTAWGGVYSGSAQGLRGFSASGFVPLALKGPAQGVSGASRLRSASFGTLSPGALGLIRAATGRHALPASRGFSSSGLRQAAQEEARRSARGQNLANASRQRASSSSTSIAYYALATIIGMIGMTYASVPLYRMFCQATGYGGTTKRVATVEERMAASEQDEKITITFNADVAEGMPWKFTPTQRQVVVRPGESTLAFYTAENLSNEPIVGVSTYNVTPMRAGLYFMKIQCFCFEEQRLLPGEKLDMPVFFYLDPDYATDPKLAKANNLTLSYTFFRVDGAHAEAAKAALDAAAERNWDDEDPAAGGPTGHTAKPAPPPGGATGTGRVGELKPTAEAVEAAKKAAAAIAAPTEGAAKAAAAAVRAAEERAGVAPSPITKSEKK